MSKQSWSKKFMGLARHIATWSKDRSTKVGCVIVDEHNRVISLGYNGFTIGMDDEREEFHERPLKYKLTEHAERNAIYSAASLGHSVRGATLYGTFYPCADCARAIVQSGIRYLFTPKPNWEHDRWGEDFKLANRILQTGNVMVNYEVENETNL